MKHSGLYLHSLDSAAAVEKLVAFYVEQHNTVMPHREFNPRAYLHLVTRKLVKGSPRSELFRLLPDRIGVEHPELDVGLRDLSLPELEPRLLPAS